MRLVLMSIRSDARAVIEHMRRPLDTANAQPIRDGAVRQGKRAAELPRREFTRLEQDDLSA
jgi:hypothetical protein